MLLSESWQNSLPVETCEEREPTCKGAFLTKVLTLPPTWRKRIIQQGPFSKILTHVPRWSFPSKLCKFEYRILPPIIFFHQQEGWLLLLWMKQCSQKPEDEWSLTSSVDAGNWPKIGYIWSVPLISHLNHLLMFQNWRLHR